MTTETVFQVHLVAGYVAWGLCFGAFIVPDLMDTLAHAAQPSRAGNSRAGLG